MSSVIQIEAGPETLRAIGALTEQISTLNTLFKAQIPDNASSVADHEWLTMAEFSKRYKISPNTVYARVKEGVIERLELSDRSPRYRISVAAPECSH